MTDLDGWQLPGTKKDSHSITSDWEITTQSLIEGVVAREVKHVPTGYGRLTEVFRADWGTDGLGVDQVFQSRLEPGSRSAWHAHGVTTDRLFGSSGQFLVVLYDARPESATHGMVNQFRIGEARPTLVVIPPHVWHGVENVGSAPAMLLNAVDQAYRYDDPDHYRLPEDSTQIPYRWS